MAIQWVAQGRGQIARITGRNSGYSKHAKFNQYGHYVGQYTKQTNKKRKNK